MTKDDTTARDAALSMLAAGLINPSEAARLVGTSRQLVMHWIKVEGVDWRGARKAVLDDRWAKIKAKALKRQRGLPGARNNP